VVSDFQSNEMTRQSNLNGCLWRIFVRDYEALELSTSEFDFIAAVKVAQRWPDLARRKRIEIEPWLAKLESLKSKTVC
jgi:hypothetical protein